MNSRNCSWDRVGDLPLRDSIQLPLPAEVLERVFRQGLLLGLTAQALCRLVPQRLMGEFGQGDQVLSGWTKTTLL